MALPSTAISNLWSAEFRLDQQRSIPQYRPAPQRPNLAALRVAEAIEALAALAHEAKRQGLTHVHAAIKEQATQIVLRQIACMMDDDPPAPGPDDGTGLGDRGNEGDRYPLALAYQRVDPFAYQVFAHGGCWIASTRNHHEADLFWACWRRYGVQHDELAALIDA